MKKPKPTIFYGITVADGRLKTTLDNMMFIFTTRESIEYFLKNRASNPSQYGIVELEFKYAKK